MKRMNISALIMLLPIASLLFSAFLYRGWIPDEISGICEMMITFLLPEILLLNFDAANKRNLKYTKRCSSDSFSSMQPCCPSSA